MNWLNRIFDYIAQFWPQFETLPPDENAVRITCLPFIGQWHSVKKPGWYMWVPLFQEWTTLNVKPQLCVVDITRDIIDTDYTIESTWAVQYYPTDIYRVCFEIEDHEERLSAVTASVIGNLIENNQVDAQKALSGIREDMAGIGLKVQKIYRLSNMTVWPIKLIADSAGRSRVYVEGE